ncbi:hypothetical protein [Paraburkholderia rhynchosiae]|uniref:hypothetical protein n=1 Tax=Paraburkholderia rhynchosiae TaxID=487049 RepID=UPI001FC9D803|nr:hypothetical protein [Paraburkholderia rhynchosiae]
MRATNAHLDARALSTQRRHRLLEVVAGRVNLIGVCVLGQVSALLLAKEVHRVLAGLFARVRKATEDTFLVQKALLGYPVLLDLVRTAAFTTEQVDAVIASSAEGYPFPTNLDKDPPHGGLAPASQQELLRRALAEDWAQDTFVAALREQVDRRTA